MGLRAAWRTARWAFSSPIRAVSVRRWVVPGAKSGRHVSDIDTAWQAIRARRTARHARS